MLFTNLSIKYLLKNMKNTVAYILLTFLFVTNINSQEKTFPYTVSLKDTANNRFSSKQFTNFGKPIIIEFWATHCKPCIQQLNSFKEIYKEWQEEYGVKIIVVSIDKRYNRKKALRFIKENKWPFEFYFDFNNHLFNKIGKGNVIPQTIIYNKDFKKVMRFSGTRANFGYKLTEDGKISDEKVRINNKGKYKDLDCDLTHYEEVLKEFVNN